MRGLLIKDWKLMLQKKRFLLVFLAMGLLMMYQGGGTMALIYMTLVAVVFSLSALSYDEYENGYPFLMTLPFDRKTYVREKYLFSVLAGAAGGIASGILLIGSMLLQGKGMPAAESFMPIFAGLPAAVLMADVMLPLQLKFGAEQGRILLFVVTAALALGLGACAELLERVISPEVLYGALSRLGAWGIVGCLMALCFLLTLLSCRVSVHIMQKKEF